eukprot:5025-Heterococcus_DN1.PRE.3
MTLRAVASIHSSTRRPHASRADISAKALAAPVVDAMPVHSGIDVHRREHSRRMLVEITT